MSLIYYTLDVFTKTPFQGAQIAVFPFAQLIPEELLTRIASELKLSETVFIYPSEDKGKSFNIRTFTPQGEVGFAGHPLLATTYVLAESGQISLADADTTICLKQKAQSVNATLSSDEAGGKFVQFTLQCNPLVDRYTPSTSELARLLSISESEIVQTPFHTRLVSDGLPYLVVPLHSQQAIQFAQFDSKAWSESSAPAMAAQEILLFSAKTSTNDSNFHARLVGPSIGFNEDPPIGSAMPVFAAYLASNEHIREGTYSFTIDRGSEQTRRSVLQIEMDKHQGRPLTVRVGGHCVLISKNELLIA